MFPFNTTRKHLRLGEGRREQMKGVVNPAQKFKFDHVYPERETNRDVYEHTVKKVAMASLEGISGTVFVYGQTGTGKTYTMMGH